MVPEFDWHTIPGFGEHDFELFYEGIVATAPANSTLLEIGCFHGRSLVHLGQLAKRANNRLKVIGIDIHPRNVLDYLEKAGLTDTVEFHVGGSLELVKRFEDKSLCFIFLDDAHEHEHVAKEIDLWMPKLSKNGILAGHDIFMHTVCEPVHAKLAGVMHNKEYQHVWWCFKQTPKDNSKIYERTTIPQEPVTPPTLTPPKLD